MGACFVLNNLLEGVQESIALILICFNFNVEFVIDLYTFFFDVATIEIFQLVSSIILVSRLKFDVDLNFDVVEEIPTELTKIPGILCVKEKKTIPTPVTNIKHINVLKPSSANL